MDKKRLIVGLVCLAVVCAVFYVLLRPFLAGLKPGEAPSRRYPVKTGKAEVYLYFAAKNGDFLAAEKRVMDMPSDPERFGAVVIEALANGPRSQDLVPTLPPKTSCRAFYIDDEKIAYVDLSSSVREGYPGGSLCELLTVYSIVNSLVLNMDEVRKVKILIDGREAETLAGHVDLRFPLAADMRMVR